MPRDLLSGPKDLLEKEPPKKEPSLLKDLREAIKFDPKGFAKRPKASIEHKVAEAQLKGLIRASAPPWYTKDEKKNAYTMSWEEILNEPSYATELDTTPKKRWENLITVGAGLGLLGITIKGGVATIKNVASFYRPEAQQQLQTLKARIGTFRGKKYPPTTLTTGQLEESVKAGEISLGKALRQNPELFAKAVAERQTPLQPTPFRKPPTHPGNVIANALTKRVQTEAGFVNVPAMSAPTEGKVPGVSQIADEFTRYRGLSSDVVEKFVATEEALPQIAKDSINISKEMFKSIPPNTRKDLQYALEEGTVLPVGTREIAQQIRGVQEWALSERQGRGYFLKGKFPDNVIAGLTEEARKITNKIARIESIERTSKKGVVKQLAELMELRHHRDDISKRIERLERTKYLHRISHKEMSLPKMVKRSIYKNKISKIPYHFMGRKFDTIRDAEQAGYNVGDVMTSVAETIYDTRVEAMKDNLIKSINKNPNYASTHPVQGWVKIDDRIMPAAKGRYYHPSIGNAVRQLTWSDDPSVLVKAYDAINTFGKMIGFYNPAIMAKNDIFQGWRAAGIKFFANIPKAIMMHIKKDPRVLLWERQGLYNNILDYRPTVRQMVRQMIEQMEQTLPQKVFKETLRSINPIRLMQTLYRVNNATTWRIDRVLRTACRLGIENKRVARGLSEFEVTDRANDFMANYGKFPRRTRRMANRIIFTPTYRVSMGRVLKDMLSHPVQYREQLFRHMAYKLFMKFGVPALAASWVMNRYGKKVKAWSEGYRVVIQEEGKREKVFAFSDPLLEETKLAKRRLEDTVYFNIAAVPQFMMTWLKKGQFDYPKDDWQRASEYFKIGGPGIRDYLNWRDEDKTTFEKWLTQFGIAYVYSREPYKHEAMERAITYEVLDAFDFIPHWFLSPEERERVNLEQAYDYYRSRIVNYERQYIRTKDPKFKRKIKEVEEHVNDRYGIRIRRTKQGRRSIRKEIKLRERLTKEEYKREKLPRDVRRALERSLRERR